MLAKHFVQAERTKSNETANINIIICEKRGNCKGWQEIFYLKKKRHKGNNKKRQT